MAILSPGDYPAIRAALSTTLTSNMLPDSVIALSIYQGAAEAEVLRLDPDAETREEQELAAIRRAAIYLTAARLAPAVPQLLQGRSEGGASYQLREMNWAERADELRDWAMSEMQTLLEAVSTPPSLPSFFSLARGRRGA